MAVDKTKNHQFLLTVPNDMLEQIDEYWHENKLKNRNDAVRDLLNVAFKTLEKEQQG